MERVFLGSLDKHASLLPYMDSISHKPSKSRAHLVIPLSKIDDLVSFLQANAIERSTVKTYHTGARDYIQFCMQHNLPLNPTPQTLARYIAYTARFIASGPKYLSGACHFLHDIYPQFDSSQQSVFVQSTICGSRKIQADLIH